MNCLYLLLLLCCCSRSGRSGCCVTDNGCPGNCPRERNTSPDCGPAAGKGGHGHGRNAGPASDMRNMGRIHEEIRREGAKRETGCPCQDLRPDPPCQDPCTGPEPLPRPFPPFADEPGCGCNDN